MIEHNIQEVVDFIDGIVDKIDDTKPLMHMIGEKVVSKSMDAFSKQSDPITGKAWSPISSDTMYVQAGGKRNSKTKRGGYTKHFKRKVEDKKILRDRGDLQSSIDYTAAKDGVEIVAAKEYAATHFFGDPSRNIRQRRYLPFTDSLDLGEDITKEILEDMSFYILGEHN